MHIRFYFILLFVNLGIAQQTFCEKVKRVNELLQEHHFTPKNVDDSLSYHVYTDFIESFDNSRTLFTKKESTALQQHQLQLDNYILNSDCSFIVDFENKFKNGLERKLDFYSKMEKESFVYDGKESLTFSKTPPDFFETETKIYTLLKKQLKMDILVDISALSTNKDSLQKNFSKLEKETKKRLIEQEKCKLSFLLGSENSFLTEVERHFLQTFVSYFDPHSAYFSNAEKNSFISGVSEDNSTYGINFMINNDSEFFIAEIIPGSSAFENKTLEINDKLIKIEELDNEIWANCSNLNQILEIINSENKTNLIFHFKKQDGTNYSVNLNKKNIKAIENKCYSFVIENEGDNYGYINIPSFYIDETGNNFLSNDLSFELLKLKKENIKGLILDLQDNGGGNIYEAIKVCGMFIDIGPVAQIAQRDTEKATLRDLNRGMSYSGSLVVVINSKSASASEFFANAIQDYKRGVIVGQNSFGKASMQKIFPLDNTNSNTDFIKITLGKFYRITGKSHQGNGLTPDVEIPTVYNHQEKHEIDYPYALSNNSIEPVSRFTKWYKDVTPAIQNSQNRITNSAYLTEILDYQKKVDEAFDLENKKVILRFTDVFQFVNQYNSIYKTIENLESETIIKTIHLAKTDEEKADAILKTFYDSKIKKIASNYSIYEAINILNDLKN